MESQKFSRLRTVEQIQRVQRAASAHFFESVFHGGSGRLDALPDRLCDFWPLFSDPRLSVVEELVKPALAENELLVSERKVAKSKPDAHRRYDSDRYVHMALLSLTCRPGYGFGGWIRMRLAGRLLVVRCGPWSERLDFRKFAHSDVSRFMTRMLKSLFKHRKHTPGWRKRKGQALTRLSRNGSFQPQNTPITQMEQSQL